MMAAPNRQDPSEAGRARWVAGVLGCVALQLMVCSGPASGQQGESQAPPAAGAPGKPAATPPNPQTPRIGPPETLPKMRAAGELEVTLRSFRTSVQLQDLSGRHTQIELRINERGRPADEWWEPRRVEYTDAAGNLWKDLLPQFMPGKAGWRQVDSLGIDLTEQPAYRIRVELVRNDRFAPQDIWTIRGLPVPSADRQIPLPRSQTLRGGRVQLLSVVGYGASAELGHNSGSPAAVLKVTGPEERYYLSQRLTGLTGWVPVESQGSSFFADLMNAKVGGRTDLTVALAPRRVVEFVAHAERGERRLQKSS
jgi:hypothetical protein